jgi:UPF0755 protein
MSNAVRVILVVVLLSAVLVACVIGGGLYLWARQETLNPITAIRLKISLTRHEDELQTPAGSDPTFHKFEVIAGDSAYTIAQGLQGQGLITNADLFVDYVRYYGLDSQLEAGTYYLQQTQTIEEIAYALTDASSATIPFTILEGWRLEEIAEIIDTNPLLDFSGADFLAAVGPGASIPPNFKSRAGIPDTLSNGQPPSLEGFMYPATYKLKPGITVFELRDELLNTFDQYVDAQMYQQAANQGFTMYQIVTLASIVEREVVIADEYSRVASVYLNRLKVPMPLDADPTVQYAIGNTRDGRWWPTITQDDYYGLQGVPNQSYSTYLNDGLPPGPIASPGLAAINAVLNPAQTEYLYFRSCDNQTHIFSTTLADHNNVVCP